MQWKLIIPQDLFELSKINHIPYQEVTFQLEVIYLAQNEILAAIGTRLRKCTQFSVVRV